MGDEEIAERTGREGNDSWGDFRKIMKKGDNNKIWKSQREGILPGKRRRLKKEKQDQSKQDNIYREGRRRSEARPR